MQHKTGYFITLEGIEGVGKTTALQFLQQYLTAKGVSLVVTREPGGTPLAESIRGLLLSNDAEPVAEDTELLLMFAARAQHIARVITPALQRGQWVVSDRFTDASFAYQGGGRGIAAARIAELAQFVQRGLTPDLTFLLDAPIEVSMARVQGRGAKDRFERESIEFFHRVRARYLEMAQAEPERFCVIDATQSVEAVQAQMQQQLQKWLVCV